MFQDLTHKQKTLIPIWEAALACVAAADAARAGLEAARFTIQMTWRAFQFASLTLVGGLIEIRSGIFIPVTQFTYL